MTLLNLLNGNTLSCENGLEPLRDILNKGIFSKYSQVFETRIKIYDKKFVPPSKQAEELRITMHIFQHIFHLDHPLVVNTFFE